MQEIKVLKENDDWLVLDKPVGVSVHNRQGIDLISFVKARTGNTDTAYPINRLDSGTCGLVLFAKNSPSAKTLQQSFEKRLVTKIYLARVQLLKNPPELGASGLWRWPLTNQAEGRRDPKGFWSKRIPCQTEWEVIEVNEGSAILKIKLLTGRKHQIRRHSAIYGWPIWGDPRYGPKDVELEDRYNLIAKELIFNDPQSGEAVTVTSSFII